MIARSLSISPQFIQKIRSKSDADVITPTGEVKIRSTTPTPPINPHKSTPEPSTPTTPSTPAGNPESSPTTHPSNSSPSGGVDTERRQIIQIEISGPSLKEAWVNHNLDRYFTNPLPDFTPNSMSSLSVYHGTHGVFTTDENIPQRIIDRGLRLSFGGRNELSPSNSIHLSYYALRSFLWSLFRSNMADTFVFSERERALQKEWRVDGQTYRGLFIVQYSFPLPPREGVTLATIDADRIGRWRDAAQAAWRRSQDELDGYWRRNADIHGSGQDRFPDVIAAQELPQTELALGSWFGRGLLRRPVWRVAITTPTGADYLESRRTVHYAISYVQTAAAVDKTRETKQQRRFRSSIRAKVHGLKRKISTLLRV